MQPLSINRPGIMRSMLAIAGKGAFLLKDIFRAARKAPSIMVAGAISQSLVGVIRLIIFMAPLKAIFMKLSGVETIHIPATSATISVNHLLLFLAGALVVANCVAAATDYYVDHRRRSYIAQLRNNKETQKEAKNAGPYYSIIRSIISAVAIFPVLLYMDPKFTILICLVILLVTPLFVFSRRLSVGSDPATLKNYAINTKTAGALSIGILIAIAMVHIASAGDISHESAVYFLIYFILLRQLAAAIQRAAEAFDKVRL